PQCFGHCRAGRGTHDDGGSERSECLGTRAWTEPTVPELGHGHSLVEKSGRQENHLWVIGAQRPYEFRASILRSVLRPHYSAQENIVCIHGFSSPVLRLPSGTGRSDQFLELLLSKEKTNPMRNAEPSASPSEHNNSRADSTALETCLRTE